jgi:uncharacterized protein (DUF1778 family)
MKGQKHTETLNLRVTPGMKALIGSIARFSNRKPSDVAREALEKGLKG